MDYDTNIELDEEIDLVGKLLSDEVELDDE